ncbi:hypothetical protein Baya_8905 [Bagarius yarrelli]|uniref:Uncharacterized protein n=1 Tax=Bagarius yarrelli TaxID=175774 RepID=A0A556U7L0_BAGYA|nr:hypothetical protein Baya_8905 [Bagarius yarrelli]
MTLPLWPSVMAGVLTLPTLPTRPDRLWAICTGLTQRGNSITLSEKGYRYSDEAVLHETGRPVKEQQKLSAMSVNPVDAKYQLGQPPAALICSLSSSIRPLGAVTVHCLVCTCHCYMRCVRI